VGAVLMFFDCPGNELQMDWANTHAPGGRPRTVVRGEAGERPLHLREVGF
jgi:hypothetical protein